MARCLVHLIVLSLFLLPSSLLAADRIDVKMASTYPITAVAYSEIVLAADGYQGEPVPFGRLAFGSDNLSNQPMGMPRCSVGYYGYDTIDYLVQASVSGGWTLGSALGDVGIDRCVIAGIFTAALLESEFPVYGRDLVMSDFADDDVLGATAVRATTDVLARNNSNPDPDDYEEVKGYHVIGGLPNSDRSMRFLFQTPLADTTGNSHSIQIIFTVVHY